MENVIPALRKPEDKTLKELSPEEFQQMLNSWFKEKGLLQDMKSYLKFQMISVLKNTVVGKNIRKTAPQTYTLAQQAIHLIVAEYLIYHQCHFALSLFSTEVNLSNILPETKLFLDPENMCKGPSNIFDKENLANILELIGISKNNLYFTTILNNYFDKYERPLLCCLLSFIGKDSVNVNDEQESYKDLELEDDDFMRNIFLILQSLKLSPVVLREVLHNIKTCYDLKMQFYESQVAQLVGKFKKELYSHEQKLHRYERKKRCLEKKLNKLKEENQILTEQIGKTIVPTEQVIEKLVSIPCSLCHCNEECTNTKRLCESYKKEIEKLKTQNIKQKQEIERLNSNCEELLKEFNNCQSKINLVNTKLQEEIIYDFQKERNTKDIESVSLSSGSVTEEILQQAKEKLKLLEEESEELDLRFNRFVIK